MEKSATKLLTSSSKKRNISVLATIPQIAQMILDILDPGILAETPGIQWKEEEAGPRHGRQQSMVRVEHSGLVKAPVSRRILLVGSQGSKSENRISVSDSLLD